MVKKLPTKAEIRATLEQEMHRYLDDGGEVQQVPRGATGADPRSPLPFQSTSLFSQPRGQRTLLTEVVQAIEARRGEMKNRRRPVRKRSRLPAPRRKVIYDDFGEPIRKVWVDD